MRKVLLVFIAKLIFLPASYLLSQEGAESPGSNIRLGGYLQTDNRMELKGNNSFSWHEYRLDLNMEVKGSNSSHFFCDVWLRSLGFSTAQHGYDLMNKDKISPLSLDLKEAYVDLYGFVFENLDIRIGRQRIAWGTADKLNPTDNLNPYDLEDIWDFGRHLGSDGLRATYYLNDWTFIFVYIPTFTPAVLPFGDWSKALSPSFELPTGLTLRNSVDNIIMPKNNLWQSSIAGFKIARKLFDYDVSLSYVYGRDYLPIVNKTIFTPTATPGEVDITSELIYPRMNIIGMDMAGAITDVGIWAEAGIFMPEKVIMLSDLSALGIGTQKSISLDDKPYVKYVIGADYTFKNGIYINGQYLHGFIHERGESALENYIMFSLEWKLMNDKLKIVPLGGGIEIKDFNNVKDNYALIFVPEINYYPVPNAELLLGVRFIDGKSSTVFGRMKDKDELFVKVKYSF